MVLREHLRESYILTFSMLVRLPIFMKIEQIFIKIEMTNLVKSNFLTGGSFNEFEALFIVVKHLSLR